MNIQFETIAKARQENPEETIRRLGDAAENDIRETVRRIHGPMQRQASDGTALVAIALFIAAAAIWLQLLVDK